MQLSQTAPSSIPRRGPGPAGTVSDAFLPRLPPPGPAAHTRAACARPPPRSLNELRVLLLEANRHSPGPERDLSREVHKAEWRLKEQKLKDDIRGLREKLSGLVGGARWRPRRAGGGVPERPGDALVTGGGRWGSTGLRW